MQDFGTKADDTAGPSGQLSAAEFNNLATELENAVLRSGQALNGASVVQMAISLFLHGVKSQTFQDSGISNAYVATPVSGSGGVLLPADYANMNGTVILIKASNTNTAASTLNIGQTTGTLLGTKQIFSQAGVAIAAGSIIAGAHVQLRFDSSLDGANGAWVLMPWGRPSTDTEAGIIELATAAEAQALSDTNRAITPATLNSAFQGANQSLVANGFQRLPGGWIVQWGQETVPNGAGTTFTLPLTFPNAAFQAVASHRGSTGGNVNVEALPVGLNQITITHNNASPANASYIILGR